MAKRTGGWYGESRRHSLASRGVRTGSKIVPKRPRLPAIKTGIGETGVRIPMRIGGLFAKNMELWESRDDYVFYYEPGAFGFGQAIEINTVSSSLTPDKPLVEVKHLSGNSWGQTESGKPRDPDDPYTLHWLIVSTEYFPNMRRAMASITGKTKIPKGKRKPVHIEPMTSQEIADYMGVPLEKITGDGG